jgi:hypothetical protein
VEIPRRRSESEAIGQTADRKLPEAKPRWA